MWGSVTPVSRACVVPQDTVREDDAVRDSEVRRMISALIGGEIEAAARDASAEATRSALPPPKIGL